MACRVQNVELRRVLRVLRWVSVGGIRCRKQYVPKDCGRCTFLDVMKDSICRVSLFLARGSNIDALVNETASSFPRVGRFRRRGST